MDRLENRGLHLELRSGFPEDRDLRVFLENRIPKDKEQGFSAYGPHRGDLSIRIDQHMGKGRLSRGQEKLLSMGLLFAQAELLAEEKNKPPVFLVDDLAAELDEDSQRCIFQIAERLRAQFIFTSLPGQIFQTSHEPIKKFHVKHGRITAEDQGS